MENSGGIQNVTVFHDIAQILAAKEIYEEIGEGKLPLPKLELKLESGKEIDIFFKNQIWEVKSFAGSAEAQLAAYVDETGYDRGERFDPIKDFHIYGQLHMSVYFMADGVVQYGLYLKEDGKKKTVNVYEARTYVNKEYAERSERAGKAQEVIISGMVAGSVKVIQGGIKIIIGAGKIITG